MRRFDVETQRTTERGDEAVILPVSHLHLDEDAILACLGQVEERLVAAGRADDDLLEDLQAKLEDRLADDGLETYLPWLGPTALLADYLPEGLTVFWLDPVRLGEQSELIDGELPRLRAGRLEHEPVLPECDELIEPADASGPAAPGACLLGLVLDRRRQRRRAGWAWRRTRSSASRPRPSSCGAGTSRPCVADLQRREGAGEAVLLLCDNKGQAGRLAELLEETGGTPPRTRPRVGAVGAGFVWPEARLACITDHEFFERYRRPTRVRHRSSGLVKERASLQAGEFVVHLEYGIGLYKGLRVITVEGVERECLLLEYADDGKVYVPVENIDQVERYSSDQGANPPLARLGSGSWLKVKGKARKAIRAMAAELIELYAGRAARPGYAFPPDSPLQRALEDSFLWSETPDQLTAIDDTKRDMETARAHGPPGLRRRGLRQDRGGHPRRLQGRRRRASRWPCSAPPPCWPTQHGETFGERFRDFPVKVATLSRFRSPAEQKDITAALRRRPGGRARRHPPPALAGRALPGPGPAGRRRGAAFRRAPQGTHQGAQAAGGRDDPERHAHPAHAVPGADGRAGHGLINTPPRDRLPIHTELCAFDERVLVEAILRELHRGGQVFFVHNRVQTIEGMAQLIRKLLPNVRVAWAHGQMPEEKLETDHDRPSWTTSSTCWWPRRSSSRAWTCRGSTPSSSTAPTASDWPSSTSCAGGSAAATTGPSPT